ncbi:MAG: UDP-N-acetylglucosamine 2-epimerase (non-hydrolyzing) [Pseudooceanicola sp.]|nr:UDP-N-acetylglucosamine 2-epimerase (non-hydrolyzing) [Pseudooceanicola sp.]
MTHTDPIRVACIVGARPNFMKMAPILKVFREHGGFAARLIHTGQHYDVEMNAVFFQQLGLPEPDLNLEVGSGTQTEQTARIMMKLEQAFKAQRPDLVLLVGDVNSTLAAVLVAAKLRIPVAHVEAGLRSFDLDMPEEINRLVTDRLSDLLLTTERAAEAQLRSEGIAATAIHFVGNVMIDTVFANLEKAVPVAETLAARGSDAEIARTVAARYALVTLHRPSNVDDPQQLGGLLSVLAALSERIPIVFTMHPRTRARIEAAGLTGLVDRPGFFAVPPLSYFEMLGATRDATIVVTDSGGLQEETTVLGVPCLTVRNNTERPITIDEGTNTLVGSAPSALEKALATALSADRRSGKIPELWDGHAAERIVGVIEAYFAAKQNE